MDVECHVSKFLQPLCPYCTNYEYRNIGVDRTLCLPCSNNMATRLLLLVVVVALGCAAAFVSHHQNVRLFANRAGRAAQDGAWNGEVVSNTEDGRIQGCTVQNVGDSVTDWIIQIDGVQADLGKFSETVYRKITADAKKQRFQGFRPGTIPPHLEPTYRAFAMDECAREATLEAMQQNNIRPFDDARNMLEIADVSIPPSIKKSKGKNKRKTAAASEEEVLVVEEPPAWLTFDNMKGAIDAGWKPGQSFSFVVKNVKGQKLKDEDVSEAKPLGMGY